MCNLQTDLNRLKMDDLGMRPLPAESQMSVVSLFDVKTWCHLGFFFAIWPRVGTNEIDTRTSRPDLARQMEGMLHMEAKLGHDTRYKWYRC